VCVCVVNCGKYNCVISMFLRAQFSVFCSSSCTSSPQHMARCKFAYGLADGCKLFWLPACLLWINSPHPLSLNLYADDPQLFFSFHPPPDFDSNITHLQNALQQISSWKTAHLLTLNSSKTEFLLIGLSKQLAKIHNSSLNTIHTARNLAFIFYEHLTFSDQILSLSNNELMLGGKPAWR